MIERYLKVERVLTRLALNAAAVLLCIAAILTFYQVVTRFVFGHPSAWSEVMARSLMIWGVFLGTAAAFREGAMIAVEAVYQLIPQRRQFLLETLIAVLCLVFLVILVWYGYQMTLRVQNQRVAGMAISMAWFYAALPVGGLFSIIALIGHYLDLWRGRETPAEFHEHEHEHSVERAV